MHGTVRKKNKRFLLRIRDELPRRIPIRISTRSGKFGSLLLPGWLLAQAGLARRWCVRASAAMGTSPLTVRIDLDTR